MRTCAERTKDVERDEKEATLLCIPSVQELKEYSTYIAMTAKRTWTSSRPLVIVTQVAHA